VIISQIWLTIEGMILHSSPIPIGYTKVNIESMLKNKYRKTELDYPLEEDMLTLGGE